MTEAAYMEAAFRPRSVRIVSPSVVDGEVDSLLKGSLVGYLWPVSTIPSNEHLPFIGSLLTYYGSISLRGTNVVAQERDG
jgi:hypothetical protein